MALSSLEAYDLVRFADQLQERLVAALAELTPKRALKAEKEWLAAAGALLQAAREPAAGLLEKVRGLPELAEVRDEYAAEFQGQWVDALERLVAGITFHAGTRDPIIEALYPHQKFGALRKADKEAVIEYSQGLERRLKSAYVSRMLAQPSFAFALPVFDLINAAFAKWQTAFVGEGMAEEQAVELRKELIADAKKLDLAVKQARLLAEAALAPVNGMYEEMGLAAKPRKRTKPTPKPAKGEGEATAPVVEVGEAKIESAESAPAEAKTEPAPAPVAEPKAENPEPAAQGVKPKRRRPVEDAEAAK